MNDPPVADDEVASTPEETPITIGVTDGDIDPDGQIDSTTVALVDSTSQWRGKYRPCNRRYNLYAKSRLQWHGYLDL